MLTVSSLLLPKRFSLVEIVHNPWLFDGKWVTQSIGLVAGKRALVGIRIAKGLFKVGTLICMVWEEDVPHRRPNKAVQKTNMKEITKRGSMTLGSAIGKLLTPTLTLVAAATILLPTYRATGDEFVLDTPGVNVSVTVPGAVGGSAIFSDHWEQPTGTGVFDPFLTLDSNGQTSTGNTAIESAYNTDGTRAIYLDQQKPNAFNKTLTYGSLAKFTVNGVSYVGFDLDANEPGSTKSLISIDNIRIYTSQGDKTLAGIGTANLDDLGKLRWAMNQPLAGTSDGFNVANWVKLNADQNNNDSSKANGGSGQADMFVFIPVSAFGTDTADSDFVWFYNLNGVHYSSDGDLAAQAGFEEWRSLNGPNTVPDGGNTLVLFGTAIVALGVLAGRRKLATVA
jgi:hypothetical protein